MVQIGNLRTERATALKQRIEVCAKEIEEARKSLFEIEHEEKVLFVKQHLNEWFWNNDSYIKPLKVEKENVLVLRVGQYEGNPYIEFESMALQNLNLMKNMYKVAPLEVETVLKTILAAFKQMSSD